MISPFSPRSLWLALAAVVLLVPSVSRVSAEDFRGRVQFRGTLKVSGPFNHLTARIRGKGLMSSDGEPIYYNATGLFERNEREVLGKYKGKLRTVANNEGTVVRKVQRRPIRVTRRKIYFTDGTIRLKRPIRALETGTYRLEGRGIFRISA